MRIIDLLPPEHGGALVFSDLLHKPHPIPGLYPDARVASKIIEPISTKLRFLQILRVLKIGCMVPASSKQRSFADP